MPTEQREFEPLMASIEKVLNELEGETLAPTLDVAVQDLRSLYQQYVDCCCRRAHVVKDPEAAV